MAGRVTWGTAATWLASTTPSASRAASSTLVHSQPILSRYNKQYFDYIFRAIKNPWKVPKLVSNYDLKNF